MRPPRRRSRPRWSLPGAPAYLKLLLARLRSQAGGGGLEVAATYLRELVAEYPEGEVPAPLAAALAEVETERKARWLDRARETYRRGRGRDIDAPRRFTARPGPRRRRAAPPARGRRVDPRRAGWGDRFELVRAPLPAAFRRPAAPRCGQPVAGGRGESMRGEVDTGAGEALRVDDLVVEFCPGLLPRKRRVLDGVSFAVERGETFGFVGPNGAGKTTTLKVLLGLIRPSRGGAVLLGGPVGDIEARRRVGFLPEVPYFYDYLSGREVLRFYARVCGLGRREGEARAVALLERVGLAAAADQRLRHYSKGMLQRLGIAQALIHDPEIVFLDEPMSGLDPIGRVQIRDLIRELRGEGKTVFMNTHVLSDVEMLCDRVAILVRGRVRFVGSPGRAPSAEEGEGAVEIVLQAVAAECAEQLERRATAPLRGHGERVEALLPAKAVDDALRLALAGDARVVSVTPRRSALEEVFLSAVAEAERGEAA